ncbi:MAG TPA: hypothetical protein VFE62_14325, partial [Gemmataceae bacterium]|nr:hypothetical protein [Gemmataceae bacterium]
MKHLAGLIAVFLFTVAAFGQPPEPPRPTKFSVKLRYYIPSPRDQHVAQYDAMIRHLKSIDFEFNPPLDELPEENREDRSKNYITGAISSANARRILDSTAVQSIQLIPLAPMEFKLPEGGNDPVLVRLELSGNFSPERQRALANQTRVLLAELGFKEPAGYDHRGYTGRQYTRIVGVIPRGKFDLLNRDLRDHPAGWLGPIIPRREQPTPLREVNPVQVIEVIPDDKAVKELAEVEPRMPAALEKISPDLWELVKGKDVPSTPMRVEIAFAGDVGTNDAVWHLLLREVTPGFVIEGQVGQFITGMIRLDQVKALAQAQLVSTIRMPRPPAVNVNPAVVRKGDNAKVLEQSGLAELHKRGYRGKGVRIGIIDRDFRGWQTLVNKKQLPGTTRLVDLTTENDPEIYPLPYKGPLDEIGHGTLCAQAAALAAPDAEIVLIRVDVATPYHLLEILNYAKGGRPSATVELRFGELSSRAALLKVRRDELLEERRIILNDFTDDTDKKAYLEFLGPLYAWLYSDREWHRLRMEYHNKLEDEHRLREIRFRDHLKEVRSLNGIPILVNALSVDSGYPLGASSPLSRILDEPTGPLWFQAIGNTRGQAWLGPYRHTPGDPALKFVEDSVKLPKDRWSNEVNFLSWQTHQGEAKADIPAKTKLRITMQWREPHDPDYYLRPGKEDLYQLPLASLRMQLLKQRDPTAQKLPADLFDLVARTTGWPQRLEHLPNGSVYEHVLEVPLVDAGRYAIRVEKQMDTQWMFAPHPVRRTPSFQLLENLAPTGIRPLGTTSLPALEKNWELRPRIFLEVIDDANRVQGRAVFADFPTSAGNIGIPADSRNVISVGAASLKNQPQPWSAFGTPAQMEL